MASEAQVSVPVPTATCGPEFVESINPATCEVVARIPATQPHALPLIFQRAREAQASWAGSSLRDRSGLLRDLRAAIFGAREEVVELIARESGKPRVEAVFAELLLALDTAGFLASRAPKWLRSERVPHHNLALKAKAGRLIYDPHGVVAIISPWNYPFAIPMLQVMSAVAGGNAVLLKPSELTPATGALIGELFERAKFPGFLVQVIQGGGPIGAALIEAGPDKVFFTGSVATGRRIAEACATKLIPTVLELGGKDAMIVLADADLDVASSAALWGGLTNCGQACLSVERVYVEQAVGQAFIELCVQKMKRLRIGPNSDPRAEIGPMIRLRQLEQVEGQLRDAVSSGAKILVGGQRRPDLGANFLEPAIVVNVDHTMRIMREETFGPVIAIREVASKDQAVEMANDSPFGLSASVWTRDARRGREIASQLRVGSVMINDAGSYYGICEAPHGGRGESGWGRSHSKIGLREMVQVKYVDLDRMPRYRKPWWFSYSRELYESASALVEMMFAPSWKDRVSSLVKSRGAKGALSRRDRL